WGIERSPLGGGRATAALRRREHTGELVAQVGEPIRDLAITSARLEQLVGDRQSREDGGFVGLDHGKRIAHPLEGGIQVRGDLAGVLRGKLGPNGVLLATDDHLDGVLGLAHAALPPPCCSRNDRRAAKTLSRSLAESIRCRSVWLSVSRSITRWRD